LKFLTDATDGEADGTIDGEANGIIATTGAADGTTAVTGAADGIVDGPADGIVDGTADCIVDGPADGDIKIAGLVGTVVVWKEGVMVGMAEGVGVLIITLVDAAVAKTDAL